MKKLRDTLGYAIAKCKEAREVSEDRCSIYAVITDRKGRVLSESANSYTDSGYLQRLYAKSVGRDEAKYNHAECRAIQQLGIKESSKRAHKISVARVLKDGSVSLARPCGICQRAISETSIKIVEYTT